jgi:LuxR family maltose regulon positive regulatory protein
MTYAPPHQDPALILKATPPRVARDLLQRERLSLTRLDVAGAQVIAVMAPAGFGKTSQLAQWRREMLGRGGIALWLNLDARDEPLRMVSGLAHAARQSVGKRGFGPQFLSQLEQFQDPIEATTLWLAEVARLSVEVLLVLDEVERAPMSTRTTVLAYLLGNAPANLRIALGARPAAALMASGELSRTPHTRVLASDLRFRQAETLAVLQAALGPQFNLEEGLQLHHLTEGWPLGVQLAVAALRRNGDLPSLLGIATADLRRYFVDMLLHQQSHATVQLLVRMSQFDLLHPELCAAVMGTAGPVAELLDALLKDTPVLLRAEGSDWMRLHPLAREVLSERLGALPEDERRTLARRGSQWLAEHGLFEAAAEQALAAGDAEVAYGWAEQSLRRMLTQGHIGAVLEWRNRLPKEALQRHPGFWMPMAWALAMSDRHADAGPLIDAIENRPDLSEADRFEASLITAAIAGFADRADDLLVNALRWPEPPAQARAQDVPIYWVGRSMLALFQGQPDQARLFCQRIGTFDRTTTYTPMSYGFADIGTGLAYLWEGRCALAERALRPALLRAEERMDRRNLVACMLASLLARASWELGHDEEAEELLTLRLDVLERQGLPDALLHAYLTMARIAEKEGRQDKAMTLLETLRAVGVARQLPRLQIAAQCEMVRQHAREGRGDTARLLSRQLAALFDAQRASVPQLLQSWSMLQVEIARAHAAMASHGGDRLPEALQAVEAAGSLAASLSMGTESIEVKLLRAEVMERSGDAGAESMRREAISLARANGLHRLAAQYDAERPGVPAAPALAAGPGALPEPSTVSLASVGGGAVLTTKEREVLALLTQNLSNKEIALAMGISEQTIKWHVKNLFTKLGGANRKHAVARARMLGLLPQ